MINVFHVTIYISKETNLQFSWDSDPFKLRYIKLSSSPNVIPHLI